jgi:hypothetical protein
MLIAVDLRVEVTRAYLLARMAFFTAPPDDLIEAADTLCLARSMLEEVAEWEAN